MNQLQTWWLLNKPDFSIWRAIANKLPDRILYWVVIRVWARFTTGKYQHRTPDSITVFEVLDELY